MDDLDRQVDVVATPEGDGEFAPDEPLQQTVVDESLEGLQKAPTNMQMEWDKRDRHHAAHASEEKLTAEGAIEHKSFLEALDEVSRGKIQP